MSIVENTMDETQVIQNQNDETIKVCYMAKRHNHIRLSKNKQVLISASYCDDNLPCRDGDVCHVSEGSESGVCIGRLRP